MASNFSRLCGAGRCSLFGALLLSLPVLSSCGQQTGTAAAATVADRQAPLDAAATCSQLVTLPLPANLIGLPTSGATIKSAVLVAADAEGNANGQYCRVLGAIHPETYTAPDIRFQVNLPTNWNGKSLQFGGGGLNGTLVTGLGRYAKQPDGEATPLARGYLTLGSDSGHQSAGGFDGNFFLNDEAMDNYGHMQIKKTHDVAMILSEAHYGRRPEFNYFIGGSQGGHEGFDAVQRYPEDYDGVVAGYPAHNVLMLHLSALDFTRALMADEGAAWLNPQEAQVLVDQVYLRCDALDAAADGIISNVSACLEATAPLRLQSADNPLRCPEGRDSGDTCLSDAQLRALNRIDTPYALGFRVFPDDGSSAVFPKWTPFEGSTFRDGMPAILGAEGPHQALQAAPADATNRFAIAQDLTLDVFNDFEPRQYAGRITELAARISANSVVLDRFRAKGGKLIYFHGLVDDFITPYSSIQYWERLQARYGADAVDEFIRFYTIPGMGHQTGVFNARLDTLSALEAWVERGEAPGVLLASDANQATAGRSRPVCRYPAWPRYQGAGDLDAADSFMCVTD